MRCTINTVVGNYVVLIMDNQYLNGQRHGRLVVVHADPSNRSRSLDRLNLNQFIIRSCDSKTIYKNYGQNQRKIQISDIYAVPALNSSYAKVCHIWLNMDTYF